MIHFFQPDVPQITGYPDKQMSAQAIALPAIYPYAVTLDGTQRAERTIDTIVMPVSPAKRNSDLATRRSTHAPQPAPARAAGHQIFGFGPPVRSGAGRAARPSGGGWLVNYELVMRIPSGWVKKRSWWGVLALCARRCLLPWNSR